MIAGKEQAFDIRIIESSCSASAAAPSEVKKSITFSPASYISPSFRSEMNPLNLKPKKVQIKLNLAVKRTEWSALDEPLQLSFTFVNGVAKNAFSLKYSDAGIVSVSVEESSLPAKNVTEEPALKSASPELRARGEISLHVRPNALLICNFTYQLPDGDDGKNSFGLAGGPMSWTVRPVIYKEQHDNSPVTFINNDCPQNGSDGIPSTPAFFARCAL